MHKVETMDWTGWAAGLFEGEGSIEIGRPPRSRTAVRLHLVSTDRDVVERFLDVAGCGSINELRSKSRMQPHWKQCWRWSTGRAFEVQRLLELWSPWLGQRRWAKAQEALTFLVEKEAVAWRTCYCGRHYRETQWNQRYCSLECQLEWGRELKRMKRRARA